jgi:hypothetical protein
MADTLCRRTAASEATALPSQLALDPAEVAEEPKLLLKLHSLSSSWTRPDLTRHFSSALGQILVKHRAKKEQLKTNRVYGMMQSKPMLLQQAVGYLATNCTTELMASAKASRT